MPMQSGYMGTLRPMALAAVLAVWRVVADLKALDKFHTDIAWHAKVAVSLQSGYNTGVVDLMGLLGWGRRNHQPVPGTAAPVVGVKAFPGLHSHRLGGHLVEGGRPALSRRSPMWM
ncbi:Hypothetical protein FKW44_000614 [Caligus rogercresseyi]|uniref:Uncharacterized protein n=1 Tax=Caligus rogercresseyi TaxID=217165 RepID=A0A7T8KHP7_CALRO|nr:Hypothetical protein FKW44_000614 [Caligus rogercresseyi]